MSNERKQLRKIKEILLELGTESEHTKFNDNLYPYKELLDINDMAWKMYLWLDEILKEE